MKDRGQSPFEIILWLIRTFGSYTKVQFLDLQNKNWGCQIVDQPQQVSMELMFLVQS
jgi:hypothetical protein